MHVDEMPDAGNAYRMPISRRGDYGGNVAGIVFSCPQAVARHLNRSQPYPLATRSAVVVEIQTRVIHRDRGSAANQER